MSIVQDLSIIALKYVARGVAHGAGEAAVSILVERFTNHTEQLNRALQRANDRAWKTLESVLAGPSFFDILKPADDNAVARQMSVVLDNQLKPFLDGKPPNFRKQCLAELQAARKDQRPQ